MGSVKDLTILEKPERSKMGRGQFVFSDRYSIFDWGEMPDHIPNKGAAITILGGYFFEKLEEMGILTQYLGLVEEGVAKKLSDVKRPVNIMEIELLRVVRPELKDNRYDYLTYQHERGGFLIPLEIIYRNSLPEGSSVFRRLKNGMIRQKDMGLDRPPVPGQQLDNPFIDVSTKLEITDRYLRWEEAKQISGLNDDEIDEVKTLTDTINRLISKEFSRIGIENEDGKIEFGFDLERRLMVVDVLGTLDECRFTYNGLPVSKEIARIFYRNTEWHSAIEEAKNEDRQHWKEMCRMDPPPLPDRIKKGISQVYCACTNEVTQEEWFENVPPLKEILNEMND